MEKTRRPLLCVVPMLLTVMLLSFSFKSDAFAASTKTEALKAYSKILTQTSMKWGDSSTTTVTLSKCSFALIYLNSDSVPELLIKSTQTTHADGSALLYTFKNGKAVLLSCLSAESALYYYKKKGVIVDTSIYQLKQVIYKKPFSSDYYWIRSSQDLVTKEKTFSKYRRSEGLTTISKSKFNKLLKKMVGSKSKTKVKFYKNTAANRKKYL